MNPPNKILLIQLRRIGDVLMTTPAIRAVKEKFPEAELIYLTEPPADQVLEHNDHLTEVWLYSKHFSIWRKLQILWKLCFYGFDVSIDFFGNPRSAFFSWCTFAKQRIGFKFRGRLGYTKKVELPKVETYSVYHKLLLLEPLGIPHESTQEKISLEFSITQREKEYAHRLFQNLGIQPTEFVVSLSPVSRQEYKVWPLERYAEIADWLIQEYKVQILFLWGPNEEYFVDRVRQFMQYSALPLYPVPSILQTRAILEKVDLHLGNDNGPRHFAIAGNTPTIAIFGKPLASNWTPPDSLLHEVVEYDPGCKMQCTWPQCAHLSCIQEITVEQVKLTIQTKLDSIFALQSKGKRKP